MCARPRFKFAVVLALVAFAAGAQAQDPSLPWRTIETGHFRVHFPVELEVWAGEVAARLEPVRDRVAAAVGYAPEAVIDVVILDPAADANGFAIADLAYPRMILWATPPRHDDSIAQFHDWPTMLTLHEDVHLVHLLRPSRSPARRWMDRAIGFGPLARGSDRWLSEGYATLLEGRVTGGGRPHSDFRDAALRALARDGRLPGYWDLSYAGDGWLEGAMAYFGGSAFLEWLEARAGEGSLERLWRRMSARERRTFDDAFEGVFGDPPDELWERFVAERQAEAIAAERAMSSELAEGELVLDLQHATGAPAVSPDGTLLAAVVRADGEPDRLTVWETDPDPELEAERERQIAAMLARDPEDVAPLPPDALPLPVVAEWTERNGVPPANPRFVGADTILCERRTRSSDARLVHDLWRWDLDTGAVRPVTHGAGVRSADPAPDGTWAIAVREGRGMTQLVRVDLDSGAIAEVTEPDVAEIVDRPRVSPDGSRVAYVRHREGRWRILVRDLGSGREMDLTPSDGVAILQPAWRADGLALYATLGQGGFLDVFELPLDRGEPRRITRTFGAALAVEPDPRAAAAYFLAMDSDGFDIRRVVFVPARLDRGGVRLDTALEPGARAYTTTITLPPEAASTALVEIPRQATAPARPYGAGRLEWRPLITYDAAPSTLAWVGGVRLGDVAGRWEAVALGEADAAGGGADGGALAGRWMGLPVELHGHLYSARERPSEQGDADPQVAAPFDVDRSGFELRAVWPYALSTGWLRLAAGGTIESVKPEGGGSEGRRLASAEGLWRGAWSRGQFGWRGSASVRGDAGETGGDGWTRAGATLGGGASWNAFELHAELAGREVDGAQAGFDRLALGGLASPLIPRSETFGRIESPALPAAARVGDRYRGWRAELRYAGAVAAAAFWEDHAVATDGAGWGNGTEIAGLEIEFRTASLPVLRVPALRLRTGVAHVLDDPDGPSDGRTRAWFQLRFGPFPFPD